MLQVIIIRNVSKSSEDGRYNFTVVSHI